MKKLSDLASVQRTLRDGIAKGYWTLEDLDIKPEFCVTPNEKHRNLLRDEVKPHPETVQATPDPRDFVPAPVPPTQPTQPDPDLCPF